jgi:uncharacterized protein YndB with AHSA1/START domain
MPAVVTVEREIAAPAQRIFDLLADPRRHSEIDGSGSVRAVLDEAPARLSPGAEFGVSMKQLGMSYKVVNTVVEFEEARRIAWHHKARVIWRYELEPTAGGTRVRETWDPSGGGRAAGAFFTLMRFGPRNEVAMRKTLDRLATAVEHPTSPTPTTP